MRTRTAGLVAACGLAAASIGLIAFLVLRNAPASGPSGPSNPPIAPPDIKDIPSTARGPDTESIMGGTGLFVQVMDRRDPTRLSSEIVSKSLEPLEAKNYRVDEPRAWIYLRDGRVVHVQSREGTLHMPDRTREPDSGTLRGAVDIRLFAPPAPGARIDLAKDQPLVRGRTETLYFDGSLGEVSTTDAIKITSARTDFDGHGLRLLINQAQERIELLRVERDGVLRHRPRAASDEQREPGPAAVPATPASTPPAPSTVAGVAPAAKPAATDPAPAPADAQSPRETFYHATFDGPVKVVQGERSISQAQRLHVWAHTIDNELAPGAIAGDSQREKSEATATPPAAEPGQSEVPAVIAPEPGASGSAESDRPASAATPAEKSPARDEMTSGDQDVVMTWPGVMEVRPVEARPSELESNELALRFEAGPGSVVIGRDSTTGSTATAETISYGATRRTVALASQTESRLERPGQGAVTASRINIGAETGIVDIPSAGQLIAAGTGVAPDAAPRSLTWADNAQFQFELADGAMTDRLRRATMIGSVVASDRGSSLTGDLVQAWLGDDPDGRPAIQRLVVRDNALARDARNGRLAASSLDVTFAPPGPDADPTPRTVMARGNVRAERDGASIDCGELDAELFRDDKGEIAAKTVAARGNVEFARDDGVRATADELRADAIGQIVDLIGDDASVGKDADIVHGSQIRLDGPARALEVFGAGRFEHQGFDPAGLPSSRADASWTKGMTFDDRSGDLNAAGDVVAVNQPDELSVETLHAERIKLRLTPLESSEATLVDLDPAADNRPGEPRTARQLVSAEAVGSELEREGGTRAAAELRKYASAQDRQAGDNPQQLQYLESPRILVDNRAGTLHTPGPGKLLVVDRRREAEPRPPAAGEAPATSRGDALFEWAASMTMSRAEGTCRMERAVKMAHSALADGALTELECETLVARIQEEPGRAEPAVDLGGASRDISGRLVEADASGAVFIRSQGKELLADGVKYDAEARTIEAWANPGSTTTLFDPANPNPLTARRLWWDLANNRIEVREAGPIIAPR